MDSRLIREIDCKLAAELEKKVGDVGGDDSVIHALIRKFSDSELPSILSIFVKYQYNLERRDYFDKTPLSVAAGYLKKDTVTFLIEHKAEINDPVHPALCEAIELLGAESQKLDMVKTLVKQGAAIDFQGKYGRSPLLRAVEHCYLEVVRFLLSHGASLVLKFHIADGAQKTAVNLAFENYIMFCKRSKESDRCRIKAKKCLDLLIQAGIDYVYRQAAGFRGNDEELLMHLIKSIDDLAGNFERGLFPEANSVHLKKYLEEAVLLPAVSLIKAAAKKQEKLAKWLSKEEASYLSNKRAALFGRSKGRQFYGPVESKDSDNHPMQWVRAHNG